MSAKQILQKLKDELGHITLVADWADREAKKLGHELEKVFGIKEPELCGHGAGEPPAGAPVEAPAEGNDASDTTTTTAPSDTPVPAQSDASITTPVSPSTTAPSSETAPVSDAGEASTAAGADTAAAVSASGLAVDASAANNAGESAGVGNTAPTTTSAPLPDAPVTAPADVPPQS